MNTCPRCFATIPADAPRGLCPRCLLSVSLGEPEVVVTREGEPATPPPEIDAVAVHFPELEIVRLVGRGGMGAVYEARQKGLGRSVALKLLDADLAQDPDFERRFAREALALARLSHPNIVAVHDSGRAGPYFFLVMELVDGPNLREALRASPITPAQALVIVAQICSALEFAHKSGVVHRDIKPENVLLARDGTVKIADFGLAKLLDAPARDARFVTRATRTMGTPHYMAPEQVEKPETVDHRADIYSLGVVLYELLTGELPLGRFPLPSQKVRIDVRLDDIVVRTLEKEPERRYQAAGEVRTAVQNVAATGSKSADTSPAQRAPSEFVRRRDLRRVAIVAGILACVLTVVLVAIGASWFWMSRAAETRQSAAIEAAQAARDEMLALQRSAHDAEKARLARRTGGTAAAAPETRAVPWIDAVRLRQMQALQIARAGSNSATARYEELEASHASVVGELRPEELAHLRIAPFAEQRIALLDALWAQLQRELDAEQFALLTEEAEHAEFERAVMPFGDVETTVRVSETDVDQFEAHVTSVHGSHGVVAFGSESPPGPFARLVKLDRSLRRASAK